MRSWICFSMAASASFWRAKRASAAAFTMELQYWSAFSLSGAPMATCVAGGGT